MKKILRFLRDSWLTLFCAVLLLGATATAWRLLDAPLDPYIYAEYAVAKSAPEYKDIIGLRADTFDWQPYDYPVPPDLPKDASAVCLSWRIPLAARFVNDHILFATTNQNAYVYLDDTLVYMHGRWDDPAAARGRAFHYIHLDQNIAGKRLTILLQSAYPGWLGSIDYMRFGSSGDFLRSISFADAIYISSLSVALSLIIFLVIDLTWRGAAAPSAALSHRQSRELHPVDNGQFLIFRADLRHVQSLVGTASRHALHHAALLHQNRAGDCLPALRRAHQNRHARLSLSLCACCRC